MAAGLLLLLSVAKYFLMPWLVCTGYIFPHRSLFFLIEGGLKNMKKLWIPKLLSVILQLRQISIALKLYQLHQARFRKKPTLNENHKSLNNEIIQYKALFHNRLHNNRVSSHNEKVDSINNWNIKKALTLNIKNEDNSKQSKYKAQVSILGILKQAESCSHLYNTYIK